MREKEAASFAASCTKATAQKAHSSVRSLTSISSNTSSQSKLNLIR